MFSAKSQSVVACILLVVLLSTERAAGALPLSLNVDWAQVPSSVQPRNLESTELGKCMCDLHRSACDPNCCCDPDCSVEKDVFDTCAKEFHSDGRAESCFTKTSATTIVRGRQLEEHEDRDRAAGEAVCVYRDNYPNDRASFFAVPDSLSPTDIAASPIVDWKSPSEELTIGGTITLLAAVEVDGTGWVVRESGNGYLTIPTGGPRGVCKDDVAVIFPRPITRTTCFREHSTATGLCDQLTADFWRTAAVGVSGNLVTSFADIVPITLHTVDAATGATISTGSSAPIFQSIFNNVPPPIATTAPVELVNETTAATSRRMEAQQSTSVTCNSVVERFETLIEYDIGPVPKITNVTVTAYVNVAGIDNVDRFKQEFSVVFRRRGVASNPQPRSGNPGYIAGSEVLVGTLLQNGAKAAIQQRIGGLAVPVGRKCADKKFKSVRFLHDVSNSGCAIDLTETEFRDVCVNKRSEALLNAILVPSVTAASALYNTTVSSLNRIARTGDAHPFDAASWVEIASQWPTVTPRYAAVRRACDNLVVGLQYIIVVGRAGAEYNPQDVILGAKVEPIIGSWVLREARGSVYFNFRVRFVRYDESSVATKSRKVVPPPILPPMDDNIFYPFRRPGRTDPGSD